MTTNLIGTRIKALREERKLSQDELARLFGFKDRQTVSAIETGERRVTAEELVIAVEKLGAPLDYFTDPFLLVGEGNLLLARLGPSRPQMSPDTQQILLQLYVPRVPAALLRLFKGTNSRTSGPVARSGADAQSSAPNR